MPQSIESLSAVMLVSPTPEGLAAFYRDVLGVPLEEEQHGAKTYWGCSLGDVHFAIYACDDFDEAPEVGAGALKLAFTVSDIDETAEDVEESGYELAYAPRDLGWCKMTAVRDPDGNYVELTELGADWCRHLEKDDDSIPTREVTPISRWSQRNNS